MREFGSGRVRDWIRWVLEDEGIQLKYDRGVN